jgi:hypothetical protein
VVIETVNEKRGWMEFRGRKMETREMERPWVKGGRKSSSGSFDGHWLTEQRR